MSERQQKTVANTEYQQSPNFTVLPADGAIIRVTREQVCLTFYLEHFTPEVRNGETVTKGVTRELKYEIRLPTSEGFWMAAAIQKLLETMGDYASRTVAPRLLAPTMTRDPNDLIPKQEGESERTA